MKIYIISMAVFFTVLATSCGNSHKSHTQEAVQIELNNGQKWKVNLEMTPYILEAEQILLQYNDNDYNALAEQLKNKNNGLIKSCTMDGKSHEELHKWLHPHIQLIDALEDAENKEEADKIISELKSVISNLSQLFPMNIKTIHTSDKEVSAKALFKGDIGSATAIQLQENGVLKEHITKTPALLLCIMGKVIYEDETKKTVELGDGDYVNIQPNIKHWLKGHSNSHLILLK